MVTMDSGKIEYEGSINADMSYTRDKFMSFLPDNAVVLDAGCGSGRDSKAFLDAGFDVTAFDASEEMCKRASEYIGRKVANMRFENMSFQDEFDGIWACASLLHVPMEQLPDIMKKMRIALKKDGVIYTSFKYGDGTKLRGERRFSDFNEKSVIPLFEAAGFEIIHNEIGTDSRPGRENEKWINVIGRRHDYLRKRS